MKSPIAPPRITRILPRVAPTAKGAAQKAAARLNAAARKGAGERERGLETRNSEPGTAAEARMLASVFCSAALKTVSPRQRTNTPNPTRTALSRRVRFSFAVAQLI